jgi:hypothetical protein
VERPDSEARVFAENNGGDSLRLAIAASNTGRFGQGRRGASNTMALRLLQFLGSLQQVLVNRTSNEFCDWSARFLGQRQQLLELLFLQEEGCPLHDHTVPYRHT